MKLFRFIKWWTKDWGPNEIFVFFTFSILLSIFLLTAIFGALGILIFAVILVSAFVVYILWNIFKHIYEKWKEYNIVLEKEQEAIVDRLKGKR